MRRLVLALYPKAWRARYARELDALLEDDPPGPAALFDLLGGALRAHLRALPGLTALERARNSVSGVLGCFLCFCFAAAAFNQTTEDEPFRDAGTSHPLMSAAHDATLAALLVAVAALVVSAAPLATRAIAEARRTRRGDLIGLILLPPLAITGVAIASGLAALWFARHPDATGATAIGLVAVASVLAAAAAVLCWVAPRAILRRIDVGRPALTFAVSAASVVAICMSLATLATAFYLVAILVDAPGLAASPDGPGGISITAVDLGLQLVAMLALSAMAALSTQRGARALRV